MNKELLITSISGLLQVDQHPVKGSDMNTVPALNDAWLYIKDGKIDSFGIMPVSDDLKIKSTIINAEGCLVLPCWCDSHSHIVFAGSREEEFGDRLQGLTYEDIAKRGGGILNSAKKLRETSEESLIESAMSRLNEVMLQGTGAIEIKSGYGLDTTSELKMLRVIQKLKIRSPLTIKSTFLGAHAIPPEYKNQREKYISLIVEEMLPRVAEECLADYCDVFCEENYFTEAETIYILSAALKYGIKPKVHANQLSKSGGIQAGVKVNAVSVDHLEYAGQEEIELLKNSRTIPTLLPGAQFFLQLPPPPARAMIKAGLQVAVASDYNPGSSPTGNMHLMMALCCILYKMTPEEALNAVTINGAAAMEVNDKLGSISVGKKANIIITKRIPSLAFIPYSFGSNLIDKVIINGQLISSL